MNFNKSRIPEELIYKIWENRDFSNGLKTLDGLNVEIIEPGQKNNDVTGPDFHNAKIRIGNLTFSGDVEIENFQSDWRNHGHHLNKRYNKVILHVSLSDDSNHGFVYTQSGRKVPSIALEKYLNEPIKNRLIDHVRSLRTDNKLRMPCAGMNSKVNISEKIEFLKELGLLRHRKKCEKYLQRLKELIILGENQFHEPVVNYNFAEVIRNRSFSGKDFENRNLWQQLFYEQLFEALGYSKNKNIFSRLSTSADIKFFSTLEPVDQTVPVIESVLFQISGLIPEISDIPDEPTSEYLRSIADRWSKVRGKYDGETFLKTDWNFFRLRPQNFPTIRIAAGARLLHEILKRDLLARIVRLFEENSHPNKIISRLRSMLIIKSDGYWAEHFNFYKPVENRLKYFLGLGRADEMITNIILPLMSVYFNLFGNEANAENVLNVYVNFSQKEGNRLINDMNNILELKQRNIYSVTSQGMIELYRDFCIKQICLECRIGKVVFN